MLWRRRGSQLRPSGFLHLRRVVEGGERKRKGSRILRRHHRHARTHKRIDLYTHKTCTRTSVYLVKFAVYRESGGGVLEKVFATFPGCEGPQPREREEASLDRPKISGRAPGLALPVQCTCWVLMPRFKTETLVLLRIEHVYIFPGGFNDSAALSLFRLLLLLGKRKKGLVETGYERRRRRTLCARGM